MWWLYAILSALFAGLVPILAKLGFGKGDAAISPNLGTLVGNLIFVNVGATVRGRRVYRAERQQREDAKEEGEVGERAARQEGAGGESGGGGAGAGPSGLTGFCGSARPWTWAAWLLEAAASRLREHLRALKGA